MVLVDTSIWIRFLADKQPDSRQLDRLLERDEVSGHELVFGELLIGDRDGRSELLTAYSQMRQAVTIPPHEVVAFVRARRLHGRGVGWIDVQLLASAVVGGLELWTADGNAALIASELGIAHEVS